MGQDKEKDSRSFGVGEKVFAKVKGYPAWPAYIAKEEKLAKNKVKYHVVFYQTNEKACCKPEDIYPYNLFKEKYGKPSKRPHFNRALELIECDTPDLAKYSLAEKMSAVQADVDEIQKETRKRALEEEQNANSDKNRKKRRAISESSEQSSQNTSQKKKNDKKSDSVDVSDKINTQETDGTDDISDSPANKKKQNMKTKKRKMTKPVKHLFHPKTMYGENPAIHLQKVENIKDSNDEEPGDDKGAAKKGEKNTGKEQQKKAISKPSRREVNKEGQKNVEDSSQQKSTVRGKRQKVDKENEKKEDDDAQKDSSSRDTISRGWKRRTREQYDITSFERGDQVFAKVRGYPPWPAVVTALANENRKRNKYHVTFYASNQRGLCSAEHIFPYELYKDEYGSPHKKNAAFNMALGLIKKAAGAQRANASGQSKRSGKHKKNDPPNGEVSDNDSATAGSHNGKSVDSEPQDDVPDRQKSSGTDDEHEKK